MTPVRDAIDIRWFEICRRLAAWRERAQMAVAWHCPRWLVRWCAIRLMSHATTGPYASTVVPDLSAMDALKRWPE